MFAETSRVSLHCYWHAHCIILFWWHTWGSIWLVNLNWLKLLVEEVFKIRKSILMINEKWMFTDTVTVLRAVGLGEGQFFVPPSQLLFLQTTSVRSFELCRTIKPLFSCKLFIPVSMTHWRSHNFRVTVVSESKTLYFISSCRVLMIWASVNFRWLLHSS